MLAPQGSYSMQIATYHQTARQWDYKLKQACTWKPDPSVISANYSCLAVIIFAHCRSLTVMQA
jgi:hypothetical protein